MVESRSGMANKNSSSPKTTDLLSISGSSIMYLITSVTQAHFENVFVQFHVLNGKKMSEELGKSKRKLKNGKCKCI